MSDFLTSAGWAGATATPIAGDASARRYTRLTDGARTAILMQDPEGDVSVFARLARHLSSMGLSAPQILAEDAASGLLLIEDLGDALFAKCVAENAALEGPLYILATDALLLLHRHPSPDDLPVADAGTLAQMTDLAFDWYAQRATGQPANTARDACIAALQDALARHAPETDVMILRDYHAENLLWLPDRSGPARAGLLDFQDALQGHRAYDLASLVTDARRDVSAPVAEAAIRHYLDGSGLSDAPFRAALAVLSAQRNLRILGVFARLAATRGKPHYVDLVPRVWAHLMQALDHPALDEVAPILRRGLPAPTPAILDRLKSACPTP
ncbi:aminoglycoside phosphotransferase family protein [Thalassococcus sp. BH17M4-6]|uniref:aminoglycoside phosphotransferase family protein n=1 Tax=Thalassococcus sp. BH17M4-6 TaxID=3413148 RepID=UPI003BD4CB21